VVKLLIANFFNFCLFVTLQKAIQYSHQRLYEISIACCDDFFAVNS